MSVINNLEAFIHFDTDKDAAYFELRVNAQGIAGLRAIQTKPRLVHVYMHTDYSYDTVERGAEIMSQLIRHMTCRHHLIYGQSPREGLGLGSDQESQDTTPNQSP